MHPEEFRQMQALEENHWWFHGKRLLLRALLAQVGQREGRRMLDIGCGTGGVLKVLAGRGTIVGIDLDDLALAFCREKGLDDVARASALQLPFASGCFDVCVMMDVLEHVDEEGALLAEVRRVLRPGGAVIVSVPAFALLWSQHDVTFEHRRRYRRGQLEARLREAGLRVEWSSYTNFFVFPPTFVWRALRRWGGVAPDRRTDFFTLPRLLNQALIATYRCEAALLRHIPLPFGVSVACVARSG